jgi:hypothetical protein
VSPWIRARRFTALTAAGAWTIVEIGLLALVWHASPNTGGGLLLWQLAGAALLDVALARTPGAR